MISGFKFGRENFKLRNDPYRIFKSSKSPAGLYARQKWLNEADTRPWKSDFDETVDGLYTGQIDDGSWRHSTIETIHDGIPAVVRELERLGAQSGWVG